jgi:hypothetical protein
VRAVIHPAALFGYSTGGAVLTLVLPLGLFIVIMIAMYFVFGRRHTVPGRSSIAGAKPVAPEPQAARDAAVAAGFPTAASGGGMEPLADRATPPKVGALGEDISADAEETAVSDTAVSDTAGSDTAVSDTAVSDTAVSDPAAGDTSADEPAAGGKPDNPE